jgi:hypothetical protein
MPDVGEVNGRIGRRHGLGRLAGRRGVVTERKVRVLGTGVVGACSPLAIAGGVRGAKQLEIVGHGRPPSAGAQCDEQIAPGRLLEIVQVQRAVALVAENLDECRPALFLRRLGLPVDDTQQVHLQRLDEEIFGITAIRTRQRQSASPGDA